MKFQVKTVLERNDKRLQERVVSSNHRTVQGALAMAKAIGKDWGAVPDEGRCPHTGLPIVTRTTVGLVNGRVETHVLKAFVEAV